MNENLDLTKILKDCPKGTKFYSSTFGNVEFLRIKKDDFINPIIIKWFKEEGNFNIEYLTKEGTFRGLGECIIFPSKTQRDWSKWQGPFVDGDIFVCSNLCGNHIAIYNNLKLSNFYGFYAMVTNDGEFNIDGICYGVAYRLATEEEKQKLFDVIKKNGYKWNAETKTLDKLIVPKFKVGDRIKSKYVNNDKFTITNIDNNKFYYGCGKRSEFVIPVEKQDNWKLVPNKFDPKSLKTFDKVLARDRNTDYWYANFFSHYQEELNYPCRCINTYGYVQCVPYNDDTKHLLATSNEAPEFYRYWED